MPTGIRRIGRPLSRVQKGLLKKPVRKANEGPMAWYKRLKRWMNTTEAYDKRKERQRAKLKKPSKKAKPKKKLTEREKRIQARKDAEDLLGIERGAGTWGKKPKPKKPPKKKPPKKKPKKKKKK